MADSEIVSSLKDYTIKCVSRASYKKFITFQNTEAALVSELEGLFEIKTHKDAHLPIYVGTHLNGIINFQTGKSFILHIPNFDTTNFAFTEAYYHLFIKNKTINFTRRLLHGPLICEQT